MITNPADGSTLVEGDPLIARAAVSDAETPAEELDVLWYLDDAGSEEPICEGSVPDEDGVVPCELTTPVVGESMLSLKVQVTDAAGSSALDSVDVLVEPSAAPTCTVLQPVDNPTAHPEQAYTAEQALTFEARCEDLETAASELVMWWSHVPEGGVREELVELNASMNQEDGYTIQTGTLPEGNQVLCIHAEDAVPKEGSDCVTIRVDPPNQSPLCEILLPEPGTVGPEGGLISLEGAVEDPDGSAEELYAIWSSDKDGELGESTPVEGYVTLSTYSLSADVHTLSLLVEDEAGALCSDAVDYTVGGGPEVEITSPLDDTGPPLLPTEQPVWFEARYSDDLTPCEELDLVWDSSVDGVIRETRGSATCQDGFDVMLSEGLHSISLIITDQSGNPNIATVRVEVADCETETWHYDLDGDGYGDDGTDGDGGDSIEICAKSETPPAGYVLPGGDCDDHNTDIHPGASEACNGLDDNCNDSIDEGHTLLDFYFDNDGDGYGPELPVDPEDYLLACAVPSTSWVESSGDCAPTDPLVHPGATELCNGADEDCDGDVDEGFAYPYDTVWYADGDGDGYGSELVSTTGCSAPTGHVATSGDCDDADGGVNPGELEICDPAATDEDCDGVADAPESHGCELAYADLDGDGYAGSDSLCVCPSDPGSYTHALSEDCDDASSSIHPAAAEICDGVDNDCEAAIDEAGGTTWYMDGDGDGYGDAGVTTTACDAPTGYVADATDCNDGSSAAHPGASELCDSLDNDCDGSVDEGLDETWYLDADGDGVGGSSAVSACAAPGGYTASTGDCDDGDSSRYPGAPESCEGVDNDCDGLPDYDEGCPVATVYSYDDDCNMGSCPSCPAGGGTGLFEWHDATVGSCVDLSVDDAAAQLDVDPIGGVCESGRTIDLTIYKGPGCTGTATSLAVSCTGGAVGWNLNCEDSDGDGYGDFDDHVDSFRINLH